MECTLPVKWHEAAQIARLRKEHRSQLERSQFRLRIILVYFAGSFRPPAFSALPASSSTSILPLSICGCGCVASRPDETIVHVAVGLTVGGGRVVV